VLQKGGGKKKNIGAKGRLGQKELLQYSCTDCINNYGASMGICNVRVSHQFLKNNKKINENIYYKLH
jgi:hypothetical protein